MAAIIVDSCGYEKAILQIGKPTKQAVLSENHKNY
jgi:hypothetical protein